MVFNDVVVVVVIVKNKESIGTCYEMKASKQC